MRDDDDHEEWPEAQHPKDKQELEIQKLFADMEKRSKTALRYLLLEGFIEPGDRPGEYNYTPEGLVLAQKQYKKMLEDGYL